MNIYIKYNQILNFLVVVRTHTSSIWPASNQYSECYKLFKRLAHFLHNLKHPESSLGLQFV